jgi:hypothetical protein
MRRWLTEELADGLCQKYPAGLGVGQASVNDLDTASKGELGYTFSVKSTMPTK